jgi:hypothetical protein
MYFNPILAAVVLLSAGASLSLRHLGLSDASGGGVRGAAPGCAGVSTRRPTSWRTSGVGGGATLGVAAELDSEPPVAATAGSAAGAAAGSSAAPTPLVLQDIGQQAMTPAQPGAAPRTPPQILLPAQQARWLRLNEAPAEKRTTAARVGLKYMPENFPVLKDGIFLREVYGMPDRIKTRANIAESGFADRILQNEPEPAPVRHFVDNTYTTNAARTMAAEIYDTKMQFADKDLDAGFFATVWPMMIKRTPWKKYQEAYPQDFVAGKEEIMNTFGKLMNAMGAL